MADITMCFGIDCPHKKKCYRYTANPSKNQSYFVNVPIDTITYTCNEFWDNGD